MSGGDDRDDLSPGVGGGADLCGQSFEVPINSPKPAVLGPLTIGSVLDVAVLAVGTSTALVVKDVAGNIGGSLTFLGYLQVINCIVQRGVSYTATILGITGGVYTVQVAPL